MPPVQRPQYRLLDGEAQHRAYPDTFEIPSREDRDAVVPGNWVKLGFDILQPTDAYERESMWVAVEESDGGRFRGSLRNQANHDVGANLGDSITFGPEHILKICEDEEDVDFQARLMQGVIVSRRIWGDGARPGVLERREPLAGTRDSGWCVFVGDEDAAYLHDPDNTRVLSIDFFWDEAHPELLGLLLEAEVGTEWRWNEEEDTYEQVMSDDESDVPS